MRDLSLYAQFEVLVLPIARSIASRLPSTFDIADLEQIGRIALLEACRKHDPERDITFLIYLRQRIRGAMLDHVRGAPYREAGHAQLDMEWESPFLPRTEEKSSDPFLSRSVDALPPRQRKVLDLRFCEGLSQNETAAALGVSRRTARREEASAIAELRRRLKRAA